MKENKNRTSETIDSAMLLIVFPFIHIILERSRYN